MVQVDALHVLLASPICPRAFLQTLTLCCQVIHPCELYLTDGRLKAILQFSNEIPNFTGPLRTNMVVPLFGWSAGDIVVSIQITYRIVKALGEVGRGKGTIRRDR